MVSVWSIGLRNRSRNGTISNRTKYLHAARYAYHCLNIGAKTIGTLRLRLRSDGGAGALLGLACKDCVRVCGVLALLQAASVFAMRWHRRQAPTRRCSNGIRGFAEIDNARAWAKQQ